MARFLILAQGDGHRWEYPDGSLPLGVPKHLVEIDGETVVHRLERQLVDRGADDICIIGPADARYRGAAARHVTLAAPHPTGTSMDKLFATQPLWSADGRTTILWGDCWYSDEAIDLIMAVDSSEPHMVRRPGPSTISGARWDESFAFTFLPAHHDRIIEVAHQVNREVSARKVHMFTWLAAWNGSHLPPDVRDVVWQPNQTHLDDFTEDFDRWSEYCGWIGRYKAGMLDVAICIAAGGNDPYRQRALEFTTAWWHRAGFDVHIGAVEPDGDLYNVSRARNLAAAQTDAEVLVFADGDTICEPHQIWAAAHQALTTGCLVQAYTEFARLDQHHTGFTISSGEFSRSAAAAAIARQQPRSGQAIGGLVAIPRSLWDRLGGYDERFQSWGAEDRAIWCAATTLAGSTDRIAGHGIHLWHPKSPGRKKGTPHRNHTIELATRYKAASGHVEQMGVLPATPAAVADPSLMLSILAESGGPLAGR